LNYSIDEIRIYRIDVIGTAESLLDVADRADVLALVPDASAEAVKTHRKYLDNLAAMCNRL